MIINFLVPQNHSSISGGNIYNKLLTDALERLGHTVNLIYERDWLSNNTQPGKYQHLPTMADSLVLCKHAGLLSPEKFPLVLPLIHMPPEMMTRCHETFSSSDITSVYWSMFRHIFVTSSFTKSFYTKIGIDEDCLTVIEPAPSIIFKKKSFSSKPFSLLNVGNSIPGKNQLALINILSRLTEYEWQLKIAGDNLTDQDYSYRLNAAIQEHALQKRVTMEGALSRKKLAHLYSQADLLISTSTFETFGMNIYDAVCGGLPVLAMEGGGVKQTLSRGSSILCDSEKEMERTLRKLFVTENDYRNVISKGQQNPPEPLSWVQKAHFLIKKLEELI